MRDTIRTGVIGVGRMGQHHCRIYAGLRQVQFVGVYDQEWEKAAAIAGRYGVQAYPSAAALLGEVDAVSIATPTPTHYPLVMQALACGVHVLVEKPLADTLAAASDLARAANHSSRVVQVGHIERFNPPYLELRNVLEGMPIIAANFRRLSPYRNSNTDVDVVLDLMIHDLDLVLDLTGHPPAIIHAVGRSPFSDSLDHSVALLQYDDGAVMTLTASRITEQKIRALEVTTADTYIEVDLLHKGISVHHGATGEYRSQNQTGVKYRQESIIERILVPNAEPLLLEIQAFLESILQHKEPSVTAQDGLNALELAFKVQGQAAHELGAGAILVGA